MSAIFSQSLNLIDETALRKLIGQAAKEGLFKRWSYNEWYMKMEEHWRYIYIF